MKKFLIKIIQAIILTAVMVIGSHLLYKLLSSISSI